MSKKKNKKNNKPKIKNTYSTQINNTNKNKDNMNEKDNSKKIIIEKENTTKDDYKNIDYSSVSVTKNEKKHDESKENEMDNFLSNTDSFKTSSIDTDEISNLIDEDMGKKVMKKKVKKHVITHLFLVLVLLICIVYFVCTLVNTSNSVLSIFTSLLITLFTISFTIIGISYKRNNKNLVFIGGVLLAIYLSFGIYSNLGSVDISTSNKLDFTGKSLTEVMKWADKNNVVVNQDYEYSDMVPEYTIISQNINKSSKGTSEITVSVSEGPNPSKEIVVPSMLTWDAERVINFINDNYLSNVSVEFTSSDQDVDTVIEQSTSGNLSRDEEIKLTISYGEELGYDEVKLIDFTNKSKFEIEFYMKQHQLKYKFNDEFSSKVKKGYGTKQSIAAGDKVKINDEEIVVTLSKGPKIKVPNLTKMDVTKLTEWAIKNKLKLKFTDKYDDSVKRGDIIKTNKNEGDILKQGDIVEVTLSRGSLKMPKFDNFDDFSKWADKYEIKYEEEHEFNDNIDEGQIISFSYKTGEIIKNNDSIIVKISNGKKVTVPNLNGLTKKEAIKKLEDSQLNYNFIYKNSSKDKDIVIGQSVSSGSSVSKNMTITVTLSNGKKEEEKSTSNKNNSINSSNNNKNNNSNNTNSNNSNSNNNNTPTPSPSPSNKPDNCSNVVAYLQAGDTYDRTVSMTNRANPKLKFTYTRVDKCSNGNAKAGSICNASSYDEKSLSTCNTYNLQVVGEQKTN